MKTKSSGKYGNKEKKDKLDDLIDEKMSDKK